MNSFLKQLAERLQVFGADIVSADEIADWPAGKLDELIKAAVLAEIQHSKGVVCSECEENCFIEPDIRTNPDTGKATGIFVCTRNPDMGRIEVDLNRLRQWKIDKRKLSRKTTKKKRKKQKSTPKQHGPKKESVFNPWDKTNNACFIHDQGNIKFYYKEQIKPIPLRPGTQAPILLAAFLEGTQTTKEIKNITGSKVPASQVVKNINRTLNSQLRKIGFEDISEIRFIYFDDNNNCYIISPKIVSIDDFEKAHFFAD